jgi:hypothetical protein
VALLCSKCGCSEVRRSVRRSWEWLYLGILLPYRCVGCNRRFLVLRRDGGTGHREVTTEKEWHPKVKAAAVSGESKAGRGK